MPRNVNPGDIRVGKGLAPEGTVEDNSLRYPERDADPLRVHIHDPSRAHMASSIGIVDAADCYVSDEVEGALQELCGHTGAGRLNGLISGGTFDEFGGNANGTGPIALAGISSTLTLVSPTEVLMNGTVFDASALTVELPAPADTYYIYLETEATHPSYRTLVAGTAPPPEVETAAGVENVMFAKVVHDGTDITSWQDARFFVRNLDRKVSYSSRQGENVDAWSEGCFATLEAFFFWAENYGDTGTSEEEKGTVLIRGQHLISQSLVVPSDHLQFVGDGEAILLVGNAALDIFTLQDRQDVSFHGINFAAQIPGTRGIVTSGVCSDIVVDSCTFGTVSGVGFLAGLSILGAAGSHRIRMSGCEAFVDGANCHAVVADGVGTASNIDGITIENCFFRGPGVNTPSVGVVFAPTVGGRGASILNTKIDDFYHGIQSGPMAEVRITNTVIKDVQTGFQTNDQVDHLYVSGCGIYLEDNLGKYGFWIKDNSTTINISDTYFQQPLTNMADTVGIRIEAPVGNETLVVVEGCQMEGFYDSVGNTGFGILFSGIGGDTFRNSTIANCTFNGSPIGVEVANGVAITGNTMSAGSADTDMDLILLKGVGGVTVTGNILAGLGNAAKGVCIDGATPGVSCDNVTVANNEITGIKTHGVHLEGEVFHTTITGNRIDGFYESAAAGVPPTAVAIVADGSDDGVPHDGVISDNVISRSMGGIWIRGFNESIPASTFMVSNNNLDEIAFDQAQRSETWDGYGTKALGCEWASDISFLGNKIAHMGIVRDNTGTPLVWANSVWCLGVYLRTSHNLMVENNTVSDSQSTAAGSCLGIVAHVNGLTTTFDMAVVSITDNTVSCGDGNNSDEVGVGVYLTDPAHPCILSDTVLRGNLVIARKGNEVTDGIRITSIDLNGVAYGGYCDQLQIDGNRLQNFDHRGIDLNFPAQGTMNRMNSAASVRIADNYLHSGGAASGCAGISVLVEAGIENGILRDFIIRDNDFANWAGYGIAVKTEGLGGGGYPVFKTVRIVGNTLTGGIPDALSGQHIGIAVLRRGGVYQPTSSLDLALLDNRIGSAHVTDAPIQAMIVDLGTDMEVSALHGFSLRGNTTYSQSDAGLPGVLVSFLGAGDAPTNMVDYSVEDNRFTNLDMGVAATAFEFNITNAGMRSLSISDNFFSGADGPNENGIGCHLQLVATTNTVATSVQWRVQGNEMLGAFKAAVVRHAVREVGIMSNMIRMAPLTATTEPKGYAAISFKVDGENIVDAGLNTLTISDNVAKGGNQGIRVGTVRVEKGVEDVGITDNTLTGQVLPAADGSNLAYGVWTSFATSADPTAQVSGVSIEGNKSTQDANWGGYHIFANFSEALNVQGASVSRNTLLGPHYVADGDYFEKASLVVARAVNHDTATDTMNLRVDDNEIGGTADTYSQCPQNGIYLYGPTDCTAFHKLENLSLSGNLVRVKANPDETADKGRGMWVEFEDKRTAPYLVVGLKIDNNEIQGDNPGRKNELSSYIDGMIVELTCEVNGLSVSNNTLTMHSTRMNRYGLRIYQDFDSAQCERDEKVQELNHFAAYIYLAGFANPPPGSKYDFSAWPTEADKFVAVTWEDVAVRDNTIMWGAGWPEGLIHFSTGKWAEFGAFVFQHIQTLYNPVAQGLPGTWVPANPTSPDHSLYYYRPICVPVWGCSITGNTIRALRSNSSLIVGGVPAGNTSDAFYGVRINACSPYLRWPNESPQGGVYASQISAYLQEGWNVVGNSSVFFMIRTEGDHDTYIGKCVECVIGHDTAMSTWPGQGLNGEPLAMNEATDGDETHMGWGELGCGSFVGDTPAIANLHPSNPGSVYPTARNHNGKPRTQ